MRIITKLLWASLAFSSSVSHAQTNMYVVLDGRWYEIPVSTSTSYAWTAGNLWFLPAARMDLCQRADGQSQVPGAFTAYVGQFSNPVHSIVDWRAYRRDDVPNKTILSITTAAGNLVCSYQVPSPLPAVIFRHGFELDVLFVQGFDR